MTGHYWIRRVHHHGSQRHNHERRIEVHWGVGAHAGTKRRAGRAGRRPRESLVHVGHIRQPTFQLELQTRDADLAMRRRTRSRQMIARLIEHAGDGVVAVSYACCGARADKRRRACRRHGARRRDGSDGDVDDGGNRRMRGDSGRDRKAAGCAKRGVVGGVAVRCGQTDRSTVREPRHGVGTNRDVSSQMRCFAWSE